MQNQTVDYIFYMNFLLSHILTFTLDGVPYLVQYDQDSAWYLPIMLIVCIVCTWRTLVNQEVILRIGPLGKLGHFESAAEIFLVYIASISLASGPILSITSWYTKVLRGMHVPRYFGSVSQPFIWRHSRMVERSNKQSNALFLSSI